MRNKLDGSCVGNEPCFLQGRLNSFGLSALIYGEKSGDGYKVLYSSSNNYTTDKNYQKIVSSLLYNIDI